MTDTNNVSLEMPAANATFDTLIDFLTSHAADLSESEVKAIKARIKTCATRAAYVANMELEAVIKEGSREGKKGAQSEIRKYQTDRPDPKDAPAAYASWLAGK